jgi:hypothetical protein
MTINAPPEGIRVMAVPGAARQPTENKIESAAAVVS